MGAAASGTFWVPPKRRKLDANAGSRPSRRTEWIKLRLYVCIRISEASSGALACSVMKRLLVAASLRQSCSKLHQQLQLLSHSFSLLHGLHA